MIYPPIDGSIYPIPIYKLNWHSTNQIQTCILQNLDAGFGTFFDKSIRYIWVPRPNCPSRKSGHLGPGAWLSALKKWKIGTQLSGAENAYNLSICFKYTRRRFFGVFNNLWDRNRKSRSDTNNRFLVRWTPINLSHRIVPEHLADMNESKNEWMN